MEKSNFLCLVVNLSPSFGYNYRLLKAVFIEQDLALPQSQTVMWMR